jgi:hypothetical protein
MRFSDAGFVCRCLYHKWALDDKVTLEWVRLNRPKYYNSYKRFWVKRFV